MITKLSLKLQNFYPIRLIYHAYKHETIFYRNNGNWRVRNISAKFDCKNLDDVLGYTISIWEHDIYRSSELKCGDVVIDAGAHVGIYSVLASKKVGKHGTVIAIEPHPDNFRQLRKNVEANGCGNVLVVKSALSWQEELSELYYGQDTTSHSLVPMPSTTAQKTACMTIDRLVNFYFLKKLDVIKINTEGTSVDVLRGAEKALKDFMPTLLIKTGHYDQEVSHIARELSGYGYQLIIGEHIIKAIKRV